MLQFGSEYISRSLSCYRPWAGSPETVIPIRNAEICQIFFLAYSTIFHCNIFLTLYLNKTIFNEKLCHYNYFLILTAYKIATLFITVKLHQPQCAIVDHETYLVHLCQMKFPAWVKLMETPV
jgi:hypothetical protein